MAFVQLDDVILDLEYLMSYEVAVPDVPSSPGAVQERTTEFAVAPDNERFVIREGAVVSGAPCVIALAELDCTELFPARSYADTV